MQPCESTTTMGECFINNITGEAIGSIYFNYVGVGTRIQLIIGVCNSTPFCYLTLLLHNSFWHLLPSFSLLSYFLSSAPQLMYAATKYLNINCISELCYLLSDVLHYFLFICVLLLIWEVSYTLYNHFNTPYNHYHSI